MTYDELREKAMNFLAKAFDRHIEDPPSAVIQAAVAIISMQEEEYESE